MTDAKPLTFLRFCERLRLKLSPSWRVLIKVAIDRVDPGTLRGRERELAHELFGRDVDDVPDLARRAHVWRLGRGSGKTTISAALGVWIALTSTRIGGPGMLQAVVGIAPTRSTAKIWLGVARELVRQRPELEALVVEDVSDGFHLRRPDGRVVAFKIVAAAKGGANVRGFDILALILDESEQFESNAEIASADGYAISDRDQYAAARPRLHGPAVFISTPWPTENLTAELFDKNFGHPVDTLCALGSSPIMRPDDADLAIDVRAELERDEENALREYFCQSSTRGSSRLLDPASIDACVVAGRALILTAPTAALLGCGGDMGLERDSSAICVVSRIRDVVELLEFDEVKPAKGAPLFPGYVVRDRFVPVMRRHRQGLIAMDGHYRQSAAEHLKELGCQFVSLPEGNGGKYDTYMALRGLVHAGTFRLPPVPRIVSQLKAITQTPMPGGWTRITQPRRAGLAHGDVISALVAAIWMADRRRAPHVPGPAERRLYASSGAVTKLDIWDRTLGSFGSDNI